MCVCVCGGGWGVFLREEKGIMRSIKGKSFDGEKYEIRFFVLLVIKKVIGDDLIFVCFKLIFSF